MNTAIGVNNLFILENNDIIASDYKLEILFQECMHFLNIYINRFIIIKKQCIT